MAMSVADALKALRAGHYSENILVQITNQYVIDERDSWGACSGSLYEGILCDNDGILRIGQKDYQDVNGRYYGLIQRIGGLGMAANDLLKGVPPAGAGSLDIVLDDSLLCQGDGTYSGIKGIPWDKSKIEVRSDLTGNGWNDALKLFSGVVLDTEIKNEGRLMSFRVDGMQYYLDEITSRANGSWNVVWARACFGYCSKFPVINPGASYLSGDNDWLYSVSDYVSEDVDYKFWKSEDEVYASGAAYGNYQIEANGSAETTVTITRSGTTATVAHTSHGYTKDTQVQISGATQTDYNGIHSITVVNANSYTFSVSNSPTTPATGTIKATDWHYYNAGGGQPLHDCYAAVKGYNSGGFLTKAGEILLKAKDKVVVTTETLPYYQSALQDVEFNEDSFTAFDSSVNRDVGYIFDNFTDHRYTVNDVPYLDYSSDIGRTNKTWRTAFETLIGGNGGMVAVNREGEITVHYMLGTPSGTAVLTINDHDYDTHEYKELPSIDVVNVEMPNYWPDGDGATVVRGAESITRSDRVYDYTEITISSPVAFTAAAEALGDAYLSRHAYRDYTFNNCLLAKCLDIGDLVDFNDIDEYLTAVSGLKGYVIGVERGENPWVKVRI